MNKRKKEEFTVSLDFEGWLRYRDLKNGIIRFYGEIDPSFVVSFLRKVDEVKRLSPSEVTIFITSPGGHVYDALAMYDAIRDLSSNGSHITIIVEGWAASAAAMIVLQAADERCCRPSTRFLFHEVRRWAFDEEKTSDLQDEVKEMEALTDMILEILSRKSGKSEKEVRKLIERKETWMSASEAKDWGLIDKIV